MKRQMFSMCLAACVLGAGAARSEAPAVGPGASAPPAARKQGDLEVRNKAPDDELRRQMSEIDAQAQQMDPLQRLTNDQLFELLQEREAHMPDHSIDPTGIIVPVAIFGFLLTGILAWLWMLDRKARRLHETVRLMVEKGAQIPPDLLSPPQRKPSDLRRGIILSATGLGLTVLLALVPDAPGAWGVGVTLLLIGLGHLLVWRLQTGKGPLAGSLSPEHLS